MPRSEGRIKVRIWDDPDWVALPIDGQWLYQLFISQAQFNHAGILPIPRRMWSNLAADADTAARITAALDVLIERRFVAIDDDTDELLVRTYIRNDVQDGPPGTFRSAMQHAMAVRSRKLRAILYAELLRLDVPLITDKKHHNGEAPITTYWRAVAALNPDDPDSGHRSDQDESPETPVDNHGLDMPPAWHAHGMVHGLGEGEGEGARLTSVGGSVGGSRASAHTREPVQSPTLTVLHGGARCPQHATWAPDRPVPKCIPCRDARLAAETQPDPEAARRRAFRAAVDACPDCDDNGRLPDTRRCPCSAHLRETATG